MSYSRTLHICIYQITNTCATTYVQCCAHRSSHIYIYTHEYVLSPLVYVCMYVSMRVSFVENTFRLNGLLIPLGVSWRKNGIYVEICL